MRKTLLTLLSAALVTTSMAAAENLLIAQEQESFATEMKAQPRSLTEVFKARYGAAPKAQAQLPDVITDPVGESKDYIKSGMMWFLLGEQIPMNYALSAIPTTIVFGSNNEVYIQNIITGFKTGTYVKGTRKGDVITVDFPQAVYYEEVGRDVIVYYAQRLDAHFDEDGMGGSFESAEDQTVTFTIKGDKIEMEDSNDGDWIIGMTDEESYWLGYGDYNTVFTESDYKPVTPPAGMKSEEMLMINNYSAHAIKVGFDGDDVYFGDVFAQVPDAWFKGTVKGNKIEIATPQYIGFSDEYNCLAFLIGAELYYTESGRKGYRKVENLSLDYDAAKKEITTEYTLFLADNPETVRGMEFIDYPLIHPNKAEHSLVPQTPMPVVFQPYDPSKEWGAFQFYLPNVSEDNYYLDPDKIYWEMDIDGEPFIFEPDEYTMFDVPTSQVPYNAEGEEMYNMGYPLHSVMLFQRIIKTIGVRAVYIDDDDKEYYSKTATIETGQGGIDSALMDVDPDAVATYYNLQGVRVVNPTSGLYIVVRGDSVTKEYINL